MMEFGWMDGWIWMDTWWTSSWRRLCSSSCCRPCGGLCWFLAPPGGRRLPPSRWSSGRLRHSRSRSCSGAGSCSTSTFLSHFLIICIMHCHVDKFKKKNKITTYRRSISSTTTSSTSSTSSSAAC